MAATYPEKGPEYYLNDIRNSLHREITANQERAILLAISKIVRIPSPKLLDLNIPFWLFKRFYIQIYLGEDKRSIARNKRDKSQKKELKDYKERNSDYYFASMPQEIKTSFNYEEKQVIKAVFSRAIFIPSRKIIDKNITFKLKKRYYLAFYLGFDRRKGKRRSANATMRNISILGELMIYFLVILFVLFFAKTVLNYDIIENTHSIDYLIEKLGLNK